LLRAGQPAKIAQLLPKLKELEGIILAIDGMQPEKGNDALYIVREAQLDLTLAAEVLDHGDHDTLQVKLLEPIKAWGIPIGGVISDAQESIRLAVEQILPGVPHRNCQFHALCMTVSESCQDLSEPRECRSQIYNALFADR